MTAQPQAPWTVILLSTAKRQLRDSAARTGTLEVRREFLASVRAILSQLAVDPLSRGDPMRHFQAAGLVQLQWLHDHILTVYGVDEANRIVYVKKFQPVLGHPLAAT